MAGGHVRETELEVIDEWVRNEEVGECGADGGRYVPATKVERGEAGEVDAE